MPNATTAPHETKMKSPLLVRVQGMAISVMAIARPNTTLAALSHRAEKSGQSRKIGATNRICPFSIAPIPSISPAVNHQSRIEKYKANTKNGRIQQSHCGQQSFKMREGLNQTSSATIASG